MTSLINSQNLQKLSVEQKTELSTLLDVYKYRWSLHAREKQRMPAGDWTYWLIKAGRGFGKTKTGSETVRIWKEKYPIINLVGATSADVRDIMVEGESGILNVSPPWDKPVYNSSARKITWANGSVAKLFSAEEPDRLRGPQCYKAWVDELASWRYEESWVQLKLGLRLGTNPQCIITTTPRPTKIIKEIVADPNTYVTNGTSYENRDNLAPAFFDQIIKMYEGTRLGRQELNAEILEDIEGALWTSAMIEGNRVQNIPELKRIVVAVDPSVTSNPDSDECGIIVAGLAEGEHAYVLDDLSGIYSPDRWAQKCVYAYEKWEAHKLVAEVNQGGDLVENNIRTVSRNVSYKAIHAYKGKYLRAEPVAALYEQGRVHHVGQFSKLEDELTGWDATIDERSPNRLDALVYAITELMIEKKKGGGFA
jgi:phage terminase large subunit-like protein